MINFQLCGFLVTYHQIYKNYLTIQNKPCKVKADQHLPLYPESTSGLRPNYNSEIYYSAITRLYPIKDVLYLTYHSNKKSQDDSRDFNFIFCWYFYFTYPLAFSNTNFNPSTFLPPAVA
jgi:hypothetical protein